MLISDHRSTELHHQDSALTPHEPWVIMYVLCSSRWTPFADFLANLRVGWAWSGFRGGSGGGGSSAVGEKYMYACMYY